MKAITRAIGIVCAAGLLLGGCGSSEYPMPRGIGSHPSDLKVSPCACLEIPLQGDTAGRTRILEYLDMTRKG